jgi:hypothetical protein
MERIRVQLQHLAPQPQLHAAGGDAPLFIDFDELATKARGVRLTGIPGIYATVVEFVRYLLHVRHVPYQLGAPDRKDTTRLYEVTKQESIPTLFVEDERPYNSWLEQTFRVCALGHGPSLIPESSADRVVSVPHSPRPECVAEPTVQADLSVVCVSQVMFGLMNEIQGEGGLLFNKRFFLVPPEGQRAQAEHSSEHSCPLPAGSRSSPPR